MDSTQPKWALVTGGSRGIGYAIAQGLLGRGYEVIVTARSLAAATQAAATLQSLGSVIPLELEVGSDASIHQAIDALRQHTDSLDVLINNAGVYPDEGVNILTISRELLASTLNINTLSAVVMTQACLPLLKRSADARVINMASGYGQLAGLSADVPSYCLSKLALNGVTLMLAQALQSQQIVVNSMCPGWVRTDMGGEGAPRSPEEGADTAIWLADEAPRSASGKFFRDRQEIDW